MISLGVIHASLELVFLGNIYSPKPGSQEPPQIAAKCGVGAGAVTCGCGFVWGWKVGMGWVVSGAGAVCMAALWLPLAC